MGDREAMSDGDGEEDMEEEEENAELDDDEESIELKGDGEDEDESEEDLEEDLEEENEEGSDMEEQPKKKAKFDMKNRGSLAERDQRIREMEEEVERMEREQMTDKHWSLMGEVNGKSRETNSLLELHLDLPMSHFQSKRTIDQAIATGQDFPEDDDSDDEGAKAQAFDIEQITKQRIIDGLFDDVVRKIDTRPMTKTEGDAEEEVLDFQNLVWV